MFSLAAYTTRADSTDKDDIDGYMIVVMIEVSTVDGVFTYSVYTRVLLRLQTLNSIQNTKSFRDIIATLNIDSFFTCTASTTRTLPRRWQVSVQI